MSRKESGTRHRSPTARGPRRPCGSHGCLVRKTRVNRALFAKGFIVLGSLGIWNVCMLATGDRA